MLGIERQQAITKLVNENGNVTISELVSLFGVSPETARKDLLALEKAGALIRTHGGAVCKQPNRLLQPLTIRKQNRPAEKEELCRYAIRFIQNGDIIAIDEGSTAVSLAKLVACTFTRLTVVTNSLEVFHILLDNPGIEPILCGGTFMAEESAFSGFLVTNAIRQLHIQKAFIFPSGVSRQFGVTDFHSYFVEVQKAYIGVSDRVFILADSEKYEKGAFYKVCDLSPAHTYITDSRLSNEIYEQYRSRNIEIIRK